MPSRAARTSLAPNDMLIGGELKVDNVILAKVGQKGFEFLVVDGLI